MTGIWQAKQGKGSEVSCREGEKEWAANQAVSHEAKSGLSSCCAVEWSSRDRCGQTQKHA